MNVQPVRSDAAYRAMMAAPAGKRGDLYRYELMAPFKEKWDCYRVPLKAAEPGGYDVVMASEMLGILPPAQVDENRAEAVRLLGDDAFWDACRRSVERSLSRFSARGIELPRQDYRFTVLLANPGHPVVRASEGYCGDGGIPGSILAWLDPNESTMRRLPAALAHEANHNVRFQFVKWRDDIALGEMLVSEGLAENFAVELFGEELAGPWVTRTTPEALAQVKPLVRAGLEAQGLAELSAYLYGDETAALMGYPTRGVPYCAGYACGYHLVRRFLDETGADIAEATFLPAADILDAARDFWE